SILGVVVAAQVAFFFWLPNSAPLQLRRLSHGFYEERDAMWRELERALSNHSRRDTLLAWGDAPLPVHAARLLRLERPVIVLDEHSGTPVARLDTARMRWLPIDATTPQIPDIVIRGEGGAAGALRIEFPNLEPGATSLGTATTP